MNLEFVNDICISYFSFFHRPWGRCKASQGSMKAIKALKALNEGAC